jgi:hypothetical protein
VILATVGGLAAAGCGSTKFVTVTNTVVQQSTATVTTTIAAAPTPIPTTTATTPVAPGSSPVLNGPYGLDHTAGTRS